MIICKTSNDGLIYDDDDVDSSVDRKRLMKMGLPFITGVSPAGVLSANTREPGGTDRLVQVKHSS